jgi:hypothetical protein
MGVEVLSSDLGPLRFRVYCRLTAKFDISLESRASRLGDRWREIPFAQVEVKKAEPEERC